MPGILSAIFGFIGGPLIDKLVGPLTDLFKAYLNKQITEAQLREKIQELLLSSVKEIEITHANVLAETYKTFWTAADTDKTNLMKIMWAAALGSQIFVLFWSQWVVPMLFAYGYLGDKGWHAGTTAEWAYLVVLGLLGMGPSVLRAGPAAGTGIVGMLKSLIGR